MIVVRDFRKVYDRTVAVMGLSLEVESGRILGLVGPNGAGKTTTLRALAGIIAPTEGQLKVAGHDVQGEPIATRKLLAYVPDDPQLFWDMSVKQHLAFTASAYRVPNADERARQLLERFELGDKLNAAARDLSRGMRQKLAICCAYLRNPRAILFDEPLTGLDPRGIRELKQSIVERARYGAAVIVSSHLLAMVEDICTDVLILESGQPVFQGTWDLLRTTFACDGQPVSLEDIFFRATKTAPSANPVAGNRVVAAKSR